MEQMEPRALAEGPFLSYALLCEKVLQEQDSVVSFIRVVDRIVSTSVGPEAPGQMPPVPVNLMLAICLKAGTARGRNAVRVRLLAPTGLHAGTDVSVPVLFEGEDRGVSAYLNVAFVATDEGLYWFEISLEDPNFLLTKVPLRVLYQPLTIGRQQ
jgi:hypothetical protein